MSHKVVFNLLQSRARGGMEKVFLDYTEILALQGYKVVTIIPQDFKYRNKLEELKAGQEILNVRGHYDFIAAIKFLLLCRKYNPEFIIAHNGRSFALVNFARKFLKKIKDVAVCHGGSFRRMQNFKYAITVSKALSEKLASSAYAGEIFFMPNFLKFDLALPAAKKQRKNFYFGAISRLDENKNFTFLLLAFAALHAELKSENLQLIIAGDGEDKANLEELALKLNIADQVKFLGWVEDSKEFFTAIDCLVHPTLIEAFGLVIIEAMANRVPVIAANNLGPKEIITDYADGLLFNPRDLEDLKQKMRLVLKNSELRKSLIRHGYELVHTKYSFSQGKRNFRQIIERINAE